MVAFENLVGIGYYAGIWYLLSHSISYRVGISVGICLLAGICYYAGHHAYLLLGICYLWAYVVMYTTCSDSVAFPSGVIPLIAVGTTPA